MADGLWRVVGIDTFAREDYELGSYATREEAMAAAHAHLAAIEQLQPRETAGELQDSVAVVAPDGGRVPLDAAAKPGSQLRG